MDPSFGYNGRVIEPGEDLSRRKKVLVRKTPLKARKSQPEKCIGRGRLEERQLEIRDSSTKARQREGNFRIQVHEIQRRNSESDVFNFELPRDGVARKNSTEVKPQDNIDTEVTSRIEADENPPPNSNNDIYNHGLPAGAAERKHAKSLEMVRTVDNGFDIGEEDKSPDVYFDSYGPCLNRHMCSDGEDEIDQFYMNSESDTAESNIKQSNFPEFPGSPHTVCEDSLTRRTTTAKKALMETGQRVVRLYDGEQEEMVRHLSRFKNVIGGTERNLERTERTSRGTEEQHLEQHLPLVRNVIGRAEETSKGSERQHLSLLRDLVEDELVKSGFNKRLEECDARLQKLFDGIEQLNNMVVECQGNLINLLASAADAQQSRRQPSEDWSEDVGNGGSFPTFIANLLLFSAVCAVLVFPSLKVLFVRFSNSDAWQSLLEFNTTDLDSLLSSYVG